MVVSLLLIGAGARARDYLEFAEEAGLKIVGVADPDKERRDIVAKQFNIPKINVYESGKQALAQKIADAALIATPDKTHHELALLALESGYHLLLEKPIAVIPEHCIEIAEAQKKTGAILSVCHVLRYAPFFQKIKEIVFSAALGKLMNIDLMEQVGYWHFAHSYVRGNWANEKESSPVLLAKSSHDLDIISWIVEAKPLEVFSTGSLTQFTEDKLPIGAMQRCTDGCTVDCVFDARKLYVNDVQGWPFSVVSIEATKEARKKALEQGPYGRCVYRCDNDVCDNQEVIIKFDDGMTANFRLRWSGEFPTRRIHLSFEKGEVIGNLYTGKIKVVAYSGSVGKDDVTNIDLGGGSHGGGDPLLLKNFVAMIEKNDPKLNLSSVQKSLQGHLLAFVAEKSRYSGKTINYQEYVKSFF